MGFGTMKDEDSHSMLKEIREQPQAIARTLERCKPDALKLAELYPLKSFDLIYITGSGTSYHAGLAGQYAMATITKTFTSVIPSSEFRYWVPSSAGKKTMVFTVSQSGESTDVLNAAKFARDSGSTVVAITNTPGSSLTKLAHSTILIHAGEEKAVTATKTYTSQLVAMFTIALSCAEKGLLVERDTLSLLNKTMLEVPRYVEDTLSLCESQVNSLADKLKSNKFIFLLGSGPNYATSLEGALKLKESSEIVAEGFATREFIHGPMQLISQGTPIIVFMPHSEGREETIRTIANFKKLGARVILVSCFEHDDSVYKDLFDCIKVESKVEEIFTPIVYIVPIQLFAFHMAIKRGLDPDRPEKLSKVVRF
jgi:glucosamine--fructose-6-phosphate aminotransferase (isomerizing)